MTFYYYLASLTGGQWALYSALESRPIIYRDKLSAMLGAKDRCRQYWGKTGTACGVRIQALHGHWEENYLVGDMAEESTDILESKTSSDAGVSTAPGSQSRTTH